LPPKAPTDPDVPNSVPSLPGPADRSSLARHPNAEEMKVSLDFLQFYGDRRGEAAQDLFWALLNSRDFLMMH